MMDGQNSVTSGLAQLREIDSSIDEVHVWQAHLNVSSSCLTRFMRTFTNDERERAERFRFARDREHFVAARGVLRDIIARYTRVDPRTIQFCYDRFGKPELIATSTDEELHFNVSHSGGIALFAFSRHWPVGIDIERVRPIAHQEIAERQFSAQEAVALRELRRDQQRDAFFRCWTRKEAYVKARGQGLSAPLERFAVSLLPGSPAELLWIDGHPHEAARWTLVELPVKVDHRRSRYASALAVRADALRVRCREWAERRSSYPVGDP